MIEYSIDYDNNKVSVFVDDNKIGESEISGWNKGHPIDIETIAWDYLKETTPELSKTIEIIASISTRNFTKRS